MTTKDEELEVVIDDADLPADFDAPSNPEPKKEDLPLEAKAKEEKREDDPIASLQRQLDEARANEAREREARTRAEQERLAAEAKVHRATGDTLASHVAQVDSAIALAKADADRAEQQVAAAMEIADYTAVAKAQRAMSRAESQIRDLENGKAELVHRQKRVAEHKPDPVRQAADPAAEFVNYLISNGTPDTKAYVSKNRDKLTTERAVQKVQGVHQMALGDGIQPDTPEYFAFIDKHMGWGAEDEGTPRSGPAKQSRAVSAPVSRDTAKANGNLSGNQVRLTKEQVALANELGISPVQYAKNMMRIAANGKDPNANGLRFSNDVRN